MTNMEFVFENEQGIRARVDAAAIAEIMQEALCTGKLKLVGVEPAPERPAEVST